MGVPVRRFGFNVYLVSTFAFAFLSKFRPCAFLLPFVLQ